MFEGFCCSRAKTSSSMSWSLFTGQIATRDTRSWRELRDNIYDLIGDTFLKRLIILRQWPVGSEIAFQPILSTSFALHAETRDSSKPTHVQFTLSRLTYISWRVRKCLKCTQYGTKVIYKWGLQICTWVKIITSMQFSFKMRYVDRHSKDSFTFF